jgi:hypothetical protein
MQETFRGTRTLRFLWQEQRGLCVVCNTKITRITGWRLHHCVPRVMGGSEAPRTAFYFIRSATTGFTASEFLSRNRVSPKEAFEGLELCERKLSCTVLRGLDGSNPVRLLANAFDSITCTPSKMPTVPNRTKLLKSFTSRPSFPASSAPSRSHRASVSRPLRSAACRHSPWCRPCCDPRRLAHL